MSDQDWAHIVFVARLSSGARAHVNATLTESLNHTMNCYELRYGPIGCSTEFLTFAHMSNLPIARHGEVDRFFTSAINTAKAHDGKLLIVMNGWDGLTTDPGSLMRMFQADASRITIRVFAEVPRSFYQVNVEQAVQIMSGTIQIHPYLEEELIQSIDKKTLEVLRLAEALLEHSTALFCRKFWNLQAIKMLSSTVKQQLQKQSGQRNTDPDMDRALDKWKCPESNCGEAFPEYTTYYAHRRIHVGQNTDFRCSLCDRNFTRKDSRDRHQRETCPKRSDPIEAAPKRPAAPRGSRPSKILKGMPPPSDSAIDYYSLNAEQIEALPRLELDPDVLSTLPLIDSSCDVIYKGEVYCRWPGCEVVTKYSSNHKLRTHYKRIHGLEVPGFKPGSLSEFSQRPHVQGLQWLTKAAVHGVENAGEKPYPRAQ